ncbi:hypothetical protein HIM_11750 [Hirsutella minnesotensis 3608]|uniref:Uncharacterized protein n=1 Tax=Hirsutella minnesotensis 3608 TaxID=1043627 RepID=A0A0F8A0U4_9HYPO|nr:hypothetical protein HIM_11750 [Hirsutella minnesotensis 3608]
MDARALGAIYRLKVVGVVGVAPSPSSAFSHLAPTGLRLDVAHFQSSVVPMRTYPHDHAIYLALKRAFIGRSVEELSPALIRGIVADLQCPYAVDLIARLGIEVVVERAVTMLHTGTFASTLAAQRYFHSTSAATRAKADRRHVLEAEVRQRESDLLSKAAEAHVAAVNMVDSIRPERRVLDSTQHISGRWTYLLQSLFPAYLPLDSQCLVIERLEDLLRLACFDFMQHRFPHLLRRRGWTCPDSIDTVLWARDMTGGFSIANPEGFSWRELVQSVITIRCLAVFRIHVAVGFLLDLFDAAHALAHVLCGDGTTSQCIGRLRTETISVVRQLEDDKSCLQIIAEECIRAEDGHESTSAGLDAEVQQLIQDDLAYQALAGWRLSLAVGHAWCPSPTTIETGSVNSFPDEWPDSPTLDEPECSTPEEAGQST